MKRTNRSRGYTLIEMLLVMGIVIMLLTLVLVAVNSMLRSSRLNRAVSLMVSSVDEAHTAGITIRHTTRIDVTAMDDVGKITRMTVFGQGLSDSFEQYPLADKNNTLLNANWKSSGTPPALVQDGSRCMLMTGTKGSSSAYWYRGSGVNAVNVSDYAETLMFARVKILPNSTNRSSGKALNLSILGFIDDGGGRSINSAYAMVANIIPSAKFHARNTQSTVKLVRYPATPLSAGDQGDGPPSRDMDKPNNSGASPTTLMVENVWYRVLLSIKSWTPESGSDKPRAIVSGKFWADGELEPLVYTVGPITDVNRPLTNGFGGFAVDNCDALVDDVLIDMRPVRLLPQGISIKALDPVNNYAPALRSSRYAFPLLFRPDGTTPVYSIIEIADTTTGDKRYVRIDQNTGRARIGSALDQVKF